MKRRDFLKISGIVGAAAATAGMDFIAVPTGEEGFLDDTGAIRWKISVTHRMMMSVRYGVVEEEIGRMVEHARLQAKQEAKDRGWKTWREAVVRTTPKDLDGDTYEVVLLKPKSKIAEFLSRYVQRAERPGNSGSSIRP